MTGYMIYDLVVEVVTPEKLNHEVLFHHIVGLISHVLILKDRDVPSAFYVMMVRGWGKGLGLGLELGLGLRSGLR